MIKIIVSAIFIISSFFIYFKLSMPLKLALNNNKDSSIALNEKIQSYNIRIARLKQIKSASVVLKKQKISTYIFTLLSFVNYMKSKGLNINIKLKRKSEGGPEYTEDKEFKPYETDTKFHGVKKIKVILKIKGYPGIDTILSIINKLYILFPIGFTELKINNKFTNINFNLYSFKGV